MDYYGADRKLSELGEQDLDDFLDHDMFTPPASDSGMDHFGLDTNTPMDSEWLDNFFDDPVLNDRMMTDALQPRRVQNEHSYSLTNGERISLEGITIKVDPSEKDMEVELLGNVINPNMTMATTTTTPITMMVTDNQLDTAIQSICTEIKQEPQSPPELCFSTLPSTMATTQATTVAVTRTSSHPQTLLKQPTIFLATQHTTSTDLSTVAKQERLVLPKVNIKVEPSFDTASNVSSPEHTTMYDSIGLPPTPPSSSNSDSEGGQSPQRSAPPSPIRHSQLLRQHAHTQHTLGGASAALSQPLFPSPMPTSGVLILSEEEKRTLVAEGYPIPNKLPLTKQEEKNLKKIRRKIKNKISAQESRRKKKEYLETLEKKVESYNSENSDLKKKVDQLENNNRSLMGQLQKLQALVAKVPRLSSASSTQTGTCLMVLVLFFAVFIGTWSPLSWSIGYSRGSSALSPVLPSAAISQHHHTPALAFPTGGAIGPETQDPASDPYSTPNMRSRVLMSLRDEAEEPFGPQIPCSYKDVFLRWFSPTTSEDTLDYAIQAPAPQDKTPDQVNQTDNSYPTKDGNLSVNYTSHVMTSHRVETVQ